MPSSTTKFFFMKFDTGKWLKDPNLSMCRPETRGIWIDLICAMHESSRSGKITGTLQQLTQVARCTTAEMSRAIEDLKTTKTANVTLHHENVTLINRNMAREAKSRESAKIRKQRQRGHAPVTRLSQGEVRSNMLEPPYSPPLGDEKNNGHLPLDSMALILFEQYPPHRRGEKIEIERALAELKPDKELFSRIISSLDVLKQGDSWKESNGKYVPNICKFLAGRQWEQVKLQDPACTTCNRSGIICRDGDRILPWTVEREVNQGLPFEVCPDCKGKNRINVPGAPIVRWP